MRVWLSLEINRVDLLAWVWLDIVGGGDLSAFTLTDSPDVFFFPPTENRGRPGMVVQTSPLLFYPIVDCPESYYAMCLHYCLMNSIYSC